MALYSSAETGETAQTNEIAMNRLSSVIIFLSLSYPPLFYLLTPSSLDQNVCIQNQNVN